MNLTEVHHGHTDSRSTQIADGVLLRRNDFEIRIARTGGADVSLVERMYAWRGYRCGGLSAAEQTRVTLQACHGENVFGTLSVRCDSGAGLAADSLYKSEIDIYRATGTVCELTRLAVDPQFGSKELLGVLFHAAYFFAGPISGATCMFIEVNPRHVAFYQRALGFDPAGECKTCERVNAPAILLRLDVAHATAQIEEYAGKTGGANSRSLYPYFCSESERQELADRAAELFVGWTPVVPLAAAAASGASIHDALAVCEHQKSELQAA
jgi:hypothetical protein